MWNRFYYFLELVFLIPLFPLFYFEGKKLRRKVRRLKPYSEYQQLGISDKSKILIIGESTAAGVGASSSDKTIAYRVFKELGNSTAILNIGKNGLLAARLHSLLIHGLDDDNWKAETAIILIGANDCFKFTPPGKFYKNLSDFKTTIQAEIGTKQIILPAIPPVNLFPSIPPVLRFFLGWHRKILMAEIQKLANAHDSIFLIDFKMDFPKTFFADDGIHPSDSGYEMMAKEISDTIQKPHDDVLKK